MRRLIYISLLSLLLIGCKSVEYVPVLELRTDTLRVTNYERDSVIVHDSVTVREKGDTLYVDRWHNVFRERLVYDTVYVSRTDSVPKPYPVIKEVPCELSSWQKCRLAFGNIFLVLLICFLAYPFIKRFLR